MKILLATDGSRHAQAANELLKRLPLPSAVELTVMTVLGQERQMYPDEMLISDEASDLFRQWRQAERSEAQQLLRREAEAFADKGWSIGKRVNEGHAAQQIIETAGELGVDLVAIGARGLSAVKRFLLGSVSEKVAKHAPCPVLIARTADDEDLAATATPADATLRVLLAYDASVPAQAAVDMLAAWPLQEQTEICLITVLTLMTYYRMDVLQHLSAEWQEEKRIAQAELEQMATRLRRLTPHVTTQVQEGPDPSQQIIKAAADFNATLIMIGHRGKNSIERFLLGSVANRVVHHALCSVLVVRQ
jgi:nucleotide-binding universal stress UspA family protein